MLEALSLPSKATWAKMKPSPNLTLSVAQVHGRFYRGFCRGDMQDSLLDIHRSEPEKLSIEEVSSAIYLNLYV